MLFLGDWIPIGNLRTDLLQNAEIKVINLECVITASREHVTDKAYPIILENSAWSKLQSARNLIVNVANNHTCDAGKSVFQAFLGKLDVFSIPYYGTIEKSFIEIEQDGIKCVIISGLFKSRSRSALHARLENIKTLIIAHKNDGNRVIITPHWGIEGEYTPYPSPAQRKFAREWLEAGADIVIGHHSHSIQGIENFYGKPVFYSLGNFHFPHAESAMYPITRFGLGVNYCEGKIKNMIFLKHEDLITTTISDAPTIEQLNHYIQNISKDLTTKRWTVWQWAKAIGKTYTEKNAASWKLRYVKNPIITLVKWSIVSLLPITLLFRIGKLFFDKELESRYKMIEDIK